MIPAASKRALWVAGIVLLLGVVAALWPSRPERILLLAPLSETQGDQGARQLRTELAACGPDAIGPILKTIQRHNLCDRDWLQQLPLALHDLGRPAHGALIAELDGKPHSLARTRLIVALQVGFSDYSRFDLWLTNAMRGGPAWYANQFVQDIGHTFPGAPPMRDPRSPSGFNPQFLGWWRTNSRSSLK